MLSIRLYSKCFLVIIKLWHFSFLFDLQTWAGVRQCEVLIGKLGTIDGLATSAIVVGKISTLAHKARNHTMEWAAFKPKALFSRAQSPEVFCKM